MERLLKPVTRAEKVKGPNNPHFTSCFMNAVLVAMFLPYIPIFDRLFLRGPETELKKQVRKFVLRLRYGLGSFNAEPLRELTGFGPGQQDAIQFLTALWTAVDESEQYSNTGDISYSTKNTDAPSLSSTQTRNLFYNSDIGRIRFQRDSKIVSVNIADAPRKSLVKFTDLTQPPQPKLVDNDTYRFYHGTTFRVHERTYREWLEGAVIPTDVLKKIVSVTLPSCIVYEDTGNMTQELFIQLYSNIRTSQYFFYSLRAIARSVGSDIIVPTGYSWEDMLSTWVIPEGGLGDLNEHFVNKYLEALYLLGYSGSATRLYTTLGSSVGSFVYNKRKTLVGVASSTTWVRPLQGGIILRTTAPTITFIKDVLVLSIGRHRGATRMSTRFCPIDNCTPWREDETFMLTVPTGSGMKRLKLCSVVINTSEASSATFETHGHYRCYVLIQNEWYAYDDLFHGGLQKARMFTMQREMETLGSLYFYVTETTYNARPKSGWSKEDEKHAKKLIRPRPPPPKQPHRGGKKPRPPPPKQPAVVIMAPSIGKPL